MLADVWLMENGMPPIIRARPGAWARRQRRRLGVVLGAVAAVSLLLLTAFLPGSAASAGTGRAAGLLRPAAGRPVPTAGPVSLDSRSLAATPGKTAAPKNTGNGTANHAVQSPQLPAALLRALAQSPPAAAAHIPRLATSATYTVDDGGDAPDAQPGDDKCATVTGTCTLRAAIEEANADNFSGAVQIELAGTDITLTSDLDPIRAPVELDGGGSTIRGAVDSSGTPTVDWGLLVDGNNVTIKDVAVGDIRYWGIWIPRGDDDQVLGSRIGTDYSGTQDLPVGESSDAGQNILSDGILVGQPPSAGAIATNTVIGGTGTRRCRANSAMHR